MPILSKKELAVKQTGIFNIFINYSTKDAVKLHPIVNLLSTIRGVRVFFAERSILPGSVISQTITANIKNADVFLVFFSESAAQSSYVQQEIGVAKANNKMIIPILLDSTQPTGMLEGVNYLNFSDPTKQQAEMQRLYSSILDNIQKKKKDQAIAAFGLLALGYLLLKEDKE